MKTSTKTPLLDRLQRLFSSEQSDLTREVMQELIDGAGGYEDVDGYISDVLTHGCQSGVVSSLIYYSDTEAFYARHKDEVTLLCEEYITAGILDMNDVYKKGNVENFLAWLAFEEVTRDIASTLRIEV